MAACGEFSIQSSLSCLMYTVAVEMTGRMLIKAQVVYGTTLVLQGAQISGTRHG